jgi:hypothetical protein
LPLGLLDPIFGKFIDDAKNCQPTLDDREFLFAFVVAMADIYESAYERRKALLTTFRDHEIPINLTMIDKNFMTDGDLSIGQYRFLIAELKDEVGSMGGEPFDQANHCFFRATRNLATEHPNSVLPCIIVVTFGL